MHTKILTVSLIVLAPTLAFAEEPAATTSSGATLELIRPSTRPMYAAFGMSPAINISNAVSQLKLTQTFGWHLDGNGRGFAVGGEMQESFGSGIFAFQIGPKAWYDLAIDESLGIYIAPTATLGLVYASNSFASDVGFNMQFGAEVKAVLNDRILVFFRPFNLDIAIGDGTAVRWDLVFGAGATF